MTTLEKLSLLLGPPYDPPAPLKEVPESATLPPRAVPRRSTLAPPMVAPTTNVNKRHSARNTTPQPEIPLQPQVWLDVGEDVMGTLEKAVSEALAERVSGKLLHVWWLSETLLLTECRTPAWKNWRRISVTWSGLPRSSICRLCQQARLTSSQSDSCRHRTWKRRQVRTNDTQSFLHRSWPSTSRGMETMTRTRRRFRAWMALSPRLGS